MRELVFKYANQYNVPAQLMFNKAHVETGGTWNPNLVSPAGAVGLFQIMPGTAKGFGGIPSILEDNIRVACDLESRLLKKAKGDPFQAEIGYNWSDKQLDTVTPFPLETWRHLQKVFPGWERESLWTRMPRKTMYNAGTFYKFLLDRPTAQVEKKP